MSDNQSIVSDIKKYIGSTCSDTLWNWNESKEEEAQKIIDAHNLLCGRYLWNLIRLGLVNADIQNRKLYVYGDGDPMAALIFLPVLYPEVAGMQEDDWFELSSGSVSNPNRIGRIRFAGPAKPEIEKGILRYGYVVVSDVDIPITTITISMTTEEFDNMEDDDNGVKTTEGC